MLSVGHDAQPSTEGIARALRNSPALRPRTIN